MQTSVIIDHKGEQILVRIFGQLIEDADIGVDERPNSYATWLPRRGEGVEIRREK